MGALSDTRTAVAAVLAQIQDDFSDYRLLIETDNRTLVNQKTQTVPYLRVEIETLSGGQESLGKNPLVEQRGQILLYACAREGSGPTLADELRDFVIPYFDRKVLGFVQCYAAVATRPRIIKGWEHYPVVVTYYYHRIAA
jgi:hypothetical protein